MDAKPITTAISNIEGRLKVDVGCTHGKKKCLKCAIRKDGKGGPGVFDAPGYGGTKSNFTLPKAPATTNKPHRSTLGVTSVKMPGIKSTLSSLSKKMKFKKMALTKPKKFKPILKRIITKRK